MIIVANLPGIMVSLSYCINDAILYNYHKIVRITSQLVQYFTKVIESAYPEIYQSCKLETLCGIVCSNTCSEIFAKILSKPNTGLMTNLPILSILFVNSFILYYKMFTERKVS